MSYSRAKRTWFEPWFAAYTLLGAVAAGLAPALLPLWASRSGGAENVGLIMAALSLGQLSAPLWGQLADRRHLYAPLFVGGLVTSGVSIAGIIVSADSWVLALLSLALGVGIASTSTLANMFIVERYPQEEWGVRLGALEEAYSFGQVGGLVAAGLLSLFHVRLGLALASFLSFVAFGFARHLPTMPGARRGERPHVAVWLQVESLFSSPLRAYHLLHLGKVLRALRNAPHELLRFHALWFVINTGSAFIFSFYPLLLAEQYGLSASWTAWGYAAAVGASLLLYAPIGRWVGRYGPAKVLQLGMAFRLLMLAALALVALLPLAARGPWALLFFAAVAIAWAPISVAGTALAASSPALPEGEAMGLFSANGALTGVVGALLAGLLVRYTGYGGLPLAATAFLAVGLGLGMKRSTS